MKGTKFTKRAILKDIIAGVLIVPYVVWFAYAHQAKIQHVDIE